MSITTVVAAKNEDPQRLQDVVDIARQDSYEVLVVVPPGDASARMVQGARVLVQPGSGKADALNYGMEQAQTDHVAFVDSDVYLEPGEIQYLDYMLSNGDSFVGVPKWPATSGYLTFPAYGWFFAADRRTFLEAGGWKDHKVEDVVTMASLMKQGYVIKEAPFNVHMARGTRDLIPKFVSLLTERARP